MKKAILKDTTYDTTYDNENEMTTYSLLTREFNRIKTDKTNPIPTSIKTNFNDSDEDDTNTPKSFGDYHKKSTINSEENFIVGSAPLSHTEKHLSRFKLTSSLDNHQINEHKKPIVTKGFSPSYS